MIDMRKYYIEVVWHNDKDNYILQSKWFDTEEQALTWVKGIDYVVEYIDVYLMSSEWNFETNTYIDIEQERKIL